MAQLRRSCFLCEGSPVGAELRELNDWLAEANFQGGRGALEGLEVHMKQVLTWPEDVVLFLALPKRMAAARDKIEKVVNLRASNSLCVLLIFSETSNSPDPSVSPPGQMNKKDELQAKELRPYRHSKAEFSYLVVSDLGRLLALWRKLQATRGHDLSSLLTEAGKEENVLEHLETTAMTSFTSLVVTFGSSCDACGTLEDAVRTGHLTCVQHLLARGREVPSAELSPLHLAVLKAGRKKAEVFGKMAKLLLAAKHDPGPPHLFGHQPVALGRWLRAIHPCVDHVALRRHW
ncbi:unnamed protein product [Symbiodinium natans]|uniref:Uncharacterized protein n=1 Tax=Symbiodinium natans TaxID=878477 RepID=A0A812SI47_9DINO|nr:unnamed protein product [Symbiodinium natans]